MIMKTPPGWYPDPKNPLPERYWDGEYWTSRVRTSLHQYGEVIEPESKDDTRGIRTSEPVSLYTSYEPDTDAFVTSFGVGIVLYFILIATDLPSSASNFQSWNFGFLLIGYILNTILMMYRFQNYPLDKPKSVLYKIRIGVVAVGVLFLLHYLFHLAR